MKIIFFSSHTATWYFAFAEAVIASALQKNGHDVVFITPGDQFQGISNLTQEKILRDEFGLKGYEIGSELSNDDFNEISLIVKRLNKNNFDKLVIDNIQISKIALYEFLIKYKKMSLDFNEEEWKECLTEIKNTLISFFACRSILKKENPDRILMYSTVYSVNHVWEKYAGQKGVPVYFLHHGVNFSDIDNTLMVAKINPSYLTSKLKLMWSKLKDIPVNKEALSYVSDHFLELLKGKHYLVYSEPKSKQRISIKEQFGIKHNQKILVAAMSSYDEIFASQYAGVLDTPKNLIFANQTLWINGLINYVKNKKDKFLIIRVHPREFPNKRDSVKSEHARMLEKVFVNLPNNVKINWPTDKISIYDLARETDVFLTAWSTVGIEMSLLGIPVVIYSKELTFYPPDLNYVGKDINDYFFKIELALKDGWNYKKIIKTYRWLALCYCRTIMRFRVKKMEPKRSIITRMVFDIWNYFCSSLSQKMKSFLIKIYFMVPGLGVGRRQRNECRSQLTETVDISKVETMLKKSGDTLVNIKDILSRRVTEKEEDRFIRHEIKRIYQVLFVPSDNKNKIRKNSLQYNLRNVFT